MRTRKNNFFFMEAKLKVKEKISDKQLLYMLLVLVFVGLIVNSLRDPINGLFEEKSEEVVVEKEEILSTSTPKLRRLIDGVLLESSPTSTLVGVIFDNAPEAWPHYGLSSANMVWEVPVEGGRTRLIGLYDINELEADTIIGPVRSARPVFLDISREFDALLAHVGGSPKSLNMIRNGYAESVNEFSYPNYYWRDNSRWMPHNLMTSGVRMKKAVDRFARVSSEIEPWVFEEDEVQGNTSASFTFGELSIDWEYDEDSNQYIRYVNGIMHVDQQGEWITAKNVAFMFTRMKTIDNELRRDITMVGEGDALVFAQGKKISGTWKRETLDARTRFYDSRGHEITFVAGKIWIEVLPRGWQITTTIKD